MIITSYNIHPDYRKGFTHSWELSQSLGDPYPWTFTVEEAPAPDGPWAPISPALVNTYTWHESKERRINKDPVFYFRVRLETKVQTCYSVVRMPYGDLSRREFLLGRDIMRREELHMRKLVGTEGEVYIVSTFGPKCKVCVDPITGRVRDSKCPKCSGTGRDPGYYGPYPGWYTFTPVERTAELSPGGNGPVAPAKFSVRMLGTPALKKNDVLLDGPSGKRYYVHTVTNAVEIRRVPIVQMLTVAEAPVTDAAYGLKP